MQTFLPFEDFEQTARALDARRLGKQRVEAMQVMRGLVRANYGWRNHPVMKMWRGYREALACYGLAICREWRRRGHADTVAEKIVEELGREPRSQRELREAGLLPPWLGEPDFHRSHRAALLRKDPGWYGAHFDEPDPHLAYVWPDAAARPEAAKGT